MKEIAVFLDRDGVINKLVYHEEIGVLDSPFTVDQFEILPNVGKAINEIHKIGFKVYIVSNQPCIGKNHCSIDTFKKIREKMIEELAKSKAKVDGEYYCFHHPEAKIKKYRKNCNCRKPKPGMLLKAAEEHDIDLSKSWMIGDGLTDIQAGQSAGCKTILIGRMKCELCKLMDDKNVKPTFIAPNLYKASLLIKKEVIKNDRNISRYCKHR